MRTRTMICLDPDQHRALVAEARKEGMSVAALIRRLIAWHLDAERTAARVPPDAYLKIVALGTSGRQDISERHDAYLGEALRSEHAR